MLRESAMPRIRRGASLRHKKRAKPPFAGNGDGVVTVALE
jgi:hypothetical protein